MGGTEGTRTPDPLVANTRRGGRGWPSCRPGRQGGSLTDAHGRCRCCTLLLADLATRVGGDAGQISRYVNGKITPSVDVVVRLAEIFDVNTDYLLVDGATRRAFRPTPDELTDRLGDLGALTEADRAALAHILDGLLANTRIRAALHHAA